MSNDNVTPEDQAAIDRLATGALQQFAAGRSVEEVSRDLQANGLAKSTADGLAEHLRQRWQEIAAAPRANADAYFAAKYPEMRPARSSPSLFTMHGIGTMLWGQRDRDAATGTFVKTHCLCVFYIPVLALAAYRVANSGGGWTLIGRVPISRFAKWWNLLLPLGIAAAIGFGIWEDARNSPEAVAARTLAEADKAAAAGNLLEASRLYGVVARGQSEHAAAAREKCAKLVDRPELGNMPLADAAQIFDEVIECVWQGQGEPATSVFERGVALVKTHAQADPTRSVALLTRLAMLSRGKACATFAGLVAGPLAGLSSSETLVVFRTASAIPQDPVGKSAFVALGTKQCMRLAESDLPASFELLSVLAPLGDRQALDDCLTVLLGAPLDKSPCGAIFTAVGVAKSFMNPSGQKKLFVAAMAWVDHHRTADAKELLALLDRLGSLEEADPAHVAAARRPLLEKLVAANPQDVDLSVQLALAIEAEGSKPRTGQDAARDPSELIVKLLLPLRGKLGTGEGARALGQALAAQGKYDDAYALLEPYLSQRLDALHAAEKAYIAATQQSETAVWDQLRNGSAPGFDFALANQLSEKRSQAMADEYVSRRLKEDPNVNSAREALVQQAMVVPAALDLGMVTLQRAQAMKDPAARRAELERAEKTFLSIRGTAGEADQYLLHLGQVYYWLGKQKEGQEEFDKLLAKHQRKPQMLYSVAGVLRELGALREARQLLEEAYDKSSDAKIRFAAAHLRAITAKDTDDEILWLERCDADNPHVKALLAESRGQRAATQGKDDEAAADYREATAIYEKQPLTSDVLNNGALAYLQLFEISGDRKALDRATEWLEKAVSLSPSDSLVLSNAATQLIRAAAQDLAGSRLNLRELQISGDLSALYYLASDQRALDEIRARARDHAGIRKALNYIERAGLLAPKSRADNSRALETYSFLRDREALKRLAERIAAAKPDAQESVAEALKFYQFKEETSTKEAIRSQIARSEAFMKRLESGVKGPDYAAAATSLIDLKLMLPENEIDADQLVRLGEEAHRSAPSYATFLPLARALMYRAGKKLAADYPEYAKATRGTSRAAAASYSVVLAMERDDALGKAARENKDVQRAVALSVGRVQAFPETRDAFTWVILSATRSENKELMAKCLVPDEVTAIMREVESILTPVSPYEAFERYFQRRAAGDAKARESLDELVKLGVPLPVGLIQK